MAIIWQKTNSLGQNIALNDKGQGTVELLVDGNCWMIYGPKGQVFQSYQNEVWAFANTKFALQKEDYLLAAQAVKEARLKTPKPKKFKLNSDWVSYQYLVNEGGEGYNPHPKYI